MDWHWAMLIGAGIGASAMFGFFWLLSREAGGE
jgi:hypothetical protein